MPTTGQCKQDPVEGVTGDIYDAWLADPDAGLADVSGGVPGPSWASGSDLRKLVNAQLAAIAAAIVANSGGGGGAPSLTVVSKIANFTAATAIHYRCNANAGAITATLPAGTGLSGQMLAIKNTGTANNVTLARTGADTIDGATSLVLVPGEAALLVAHSGGWDLI